MPGGFIAAISSCSVDALSLLWKHDDDTSLYSLTSTRKILGYIAQINKEIT